MMQMIAYNDPLDPLQEDPGHGIAARYDLPQADSYDNTLRPTGALEFKVSCSAMVKKLMTVSEIGQSRSHGSSCTHSNSINGTTFHVQTAVGSATSFRKS